ncbi:MAG TPA: cytochrome c, partial [Pseudomonadota bacterium]|nr:cytochrome c [Pseudomonadota bacterium]
MRNQRYLLWIALALSGAVVADDVSNERIPKQGLDAGKASFLANCAACHQPEGTGMAGAFPPLAGSDYLTKNTKASVVASILKGISGEITVNGNKFNGVMPAMSHLTDADVANIVTFIYASWGNPGGEVSTKDVAKARKTLAVTSDPAQGERHVGTKQSEQSYQGAPSTVKSGDVKMIVSPGAPSLSETE